MQSQLRGRHMRIPDWIFQRRSIRCGCHHRLRYRSLPALEREYSRLLTRGRPASADVCSMMISNMAAGNVSIQLGFKGKCTNVVTAWHASRTHCIGDALRAIQYGDAVMMLAGGTGEPVFVKPGWQVYESDSAFGTETIRCGLLFRLIRIGGFVLGEGAQLSCSRS